MNEQLLQQAIDDLRKVLIKDEDWLPCDFCAHNIECLGEECKFYDWELTCMDFEFGTCRMLENTPCEDCDFEHNWEWRGISKNNKEGK